MKKILCVLLVLFSISTISAQAKKINVKKSLISWTGRKVTGEHVGIIKFKDGVLIFKDKKVAGGSFTADMTTLENTDQTGKSKAKLEGHLKSADFFNTEEYKTAKLDFKTIKLKKKNNYEVVADLTIKGKTNPVTFDLVIIGNKADANLVIDRTKYGIQYGSGSFFDDLGDQTIYDEFEFKVTLFF